MEFIESCKHQNNVGPGRTVYSSRYSTSLTRDSETGLFWKYSKNYFKEKLIQQTNRIGKSFTYYFWKENMNLGF